MVSGRAHSFPAAAVAALSEDSQRLLQRLDNALDVGYGASPLREAAAAGAVETAMLHFDGERYRLIAWSVMPNHVHALVEQIEGFPSAGIVHSWKSFTAHAINKILARRGPVWAADYFDRFIRNEAHFHAPIDSIDQNAVKAGLIAEPSAWRFCSARRQGEF